MSGPYFAATSYSCAGPSIYTFVRDSCARSCHAFGYRGLTISHDTPLCASVGIGVGAGDIVDVCNVTEDLVDDIAAVGVVDSRLDSLDDDEPGPAMEVDADDVERTEVDCAERAPELFAESDRPR